MGLSAVADEHLWTDLKGARGAVARRGRKAAIRTLVSLAQEQTGVTMPGGRLGAWAANRMALALLSRADDQMLAWAWRDDPGLAVAIAHVQEATPQVRIARATAPIEYDDTESFPNPHLGDGEKLAITQTRGAGEIATVSYTWDLGERFVVLSAVCLDPGRLDALAAPLDALARSLRTTDGMVLGEA